MCPGPVFSNLLSIAHTERAGEVRQREMYHLYAHMSPIYDECQTQSVLALPREWDHQQIT